MAFLLNGNPLAVDVPFTVGDINYPANWLRLTTKAEKEAIGITEIADPDVYDLRFYWEDGTARAVVYVNESDKDGNLVKNIDGSQRIRLGVKTILKAQEKEIAKSLLNEYDWQVVRKAEKGTEIDSAIVTYRDGIRTAYTTRKTEIDNCVDTAALVTLYDRKEDGTPNMTQYPKDPYNTTI